MSIPQISDSEWEVMKIIWEKDTCTANEIIDSLEKSDKWQPKTVRTLISRLLKKEVIAYKVDEEDKKTYHYYPKYLEKQCVREESESFIKRVFNGSINSMLTNFIEEAKLSEQEIDELKEILNKKKG